MEYNSYEADKKRFRLWTAGILLGLLLLVAIGWFSRSAYRHFKEQRGAAQAQSFLAAGDYRSAVLSARQVLQLDQTNVPACRVMAELADLSHSPATLDWQRRIVQAEPTVENKLRLAAAGLRYLKAPFPLTTQILDELTPAATNLAGYHVVAASLALNLHRLAEAESHFEIAASLEPTNRLFVLNLAILRLSETNEAKAAQSRTVLQQLQTDASLGASALRALMTDRMAHQDLATAKKYSTRLLAIAHATLDDRLQELYILRQMKSVEFTGRLQAVQLQVATNAPAIAQVSAWMQANDLLADNLRWLTNLPASLQAQPPVRLVLADGYLQSQDWPALRDFASQGNWGEMEFLRLALSARAWSQLGVSQVADSNWSSAVNEAGNRYGALTTLLGLTEQWKMPDQHQDLLARIVEKFPQERWAQQTLAQLYFTAGKTAELNQFYARLFARFPKEESFENNLAATALLLKTNLTQAGQWAAEVYSNSPGNPDAASTYAYALHLQGRDQAGLAVLQKFTPKQLEEPSVALYYGVLLAATQNASAASYLEIARTQGHLLPEEQQLLAEALAK